MAFKFVDRARMSVTGAPGTGTIALNAATSGAQSFSAAGVSDGDTFPYLAEDVGFAWELGVATYSATGPTITRTLRQSSTGSLLSLTSSAIIGCSLAAEDMGTLTGAKSGYTALTFGSAVTIFGNSGVYKSDQSFSLSVGSLMEVESYVHGTSGTLCMMGISADATSGYYIDFNASGSQELYSHNSGGSDNQQDNSGLNVPFTGVHYMFMRLQPITSGPRNLLSTSIDHVGYSANNTDNTMTGTANVYILTDDITKCSARVRVGGGGMF